VVKQPESTLHVQPLLPGQPKVTVIGGPGRECEVNGNNYSYLATKKYRSAYKGPDVDKPKPQLGLWRLEIEHPQPAAKRLFVTVLTAGDKDEQAPACRLAEEGPRLQIHVGDACVTLERE
jgi:hypothetical protein